MVEKNNKICILIVDDEKASREVLLGLLSKGDRVIQTAKDGLEAQNALKEGMIDLILTDLNMPGMDGMELLRYVKSNYPQTMVVMITGYATLENTLLAINEGAYDYITKPFKLAEMEVLIRNACEKIMLTRERDILIHQIEGTQTDIEFLGKRVKTMQSRIQQLEEREESLFLGNFDLRLPITKETLPLRYSQGENEERSRKLLISRMEEMKENGEMNEEDFHQYLKKLKKN